MAGICQNNCGAQATPPQSYSDGCAVNTAFANGEYMFFVDCEFDGDLNDPLAIEAALLAGQIKATPRGKVVKGKSTTNTLDDAFGCGESINLSLETPITFSTPLATCDSTADNVYWNFINDNFLGLRVFWGDCCNKIHYDEGADNPGFKFELTEPFEFVEVQDGIGQWEGIITIIRTESIGVMYNPAVATALGIG